MESSGESDGLVGVDGGEGLGETGQDGEEQAVGGTVEVEGDGGSGGGGSGADAESGEGLDGQSRVGGRAASDEGAGQGEDLVKGLRSLKIYETVYKYPKIILTSKAPDQGVPFSTADPTQAT